MSNKIVKLLKKCDDHICGYGLVSDLIGETCHYGISHEEAAKYDDFYTEFEENPNIEPHEIYDFCSWSGKKYNIRKIPRGTLKVFGVIYPKLHYGEGI